MSKVLFILDRAHGKNVRGKASPDGSFVEWQYSQKVVDALAMELSNMDIPYALTATSDSEPGISARVNIANHYSDKVKHPILLSFHNNAALKSIQGQASGNELFVKRNPTAADILVANTFAENLKRDFPQMGWRKHSPYKLYKEANFTVIAGNTKVKPNYAGILIEFGFMDNPKDLDLLKDESIFKRYVDSLLYSIVQLCDHYGYKDFLTPKI